MWSFKRLESLPKWHFFQSFLESSAMISKFWISLLQWNMAGKSPNDTVGFPIKTSPRAHQTIQVKSSHLFIWNSYIWILHTVDGRNPAPVDRWPIPLFTGFQPSKVMQDFATIHSMWFHPLYHSLWGVLNTGNWTGIQPPLQILPVWNLDCAVPQCCLPRTRKKKLVYQAIRYY